MTDQRLPIPNTQWYLSRSQNAIQWDKLSSFYRTRYQNEGFEKHTEFVQLYQLQLNEFNVIRIAISFVPAQTSRPARAKRFYSKNYPLASIVFRLIAILHGRPFQIIACHRILTARFIRNKIHVQATGGKRDEGSWNNISDLIQRKGFFWDRGTERIYVRCWKTVSYDRVCAIVR